MEPAEPSGVLVDVLVGAEEEVVAAAMPYRVVARELEDIIRRRFEQGRGQASCATRHGQGVVVVSEGSGE